MRYASPRNNAVNTTKKKGLFRRRFHIRKFEKEKGGSLTRRRFLIKKKRNRKKKK